MTIDTVKHTFRHQTLGEYNDDVYRLKTFDARDHEFSFQLRPSADTHFWRFGLAFSPDENFQFDPNNGRYANQELRFIEVNVGDRASGQWQNPNNIALSSYYFNDLTPPYDPSNEYESGAEVILELRYIEDENEDPSILWFKYNIAGHQGEPIFISIGDYRYFRLFAWADHTSFELDMTATDIKKTVEPHYWLLRLMEGTWDLSKFEVGKKIWHGSRTSQGENRQEYARYKKIRKGDKVLGIAVSKYQSIICSFEVDQPLHEDPEYGQIIWLTIARLFFPYIPLPADSLYWYSFDFHDNRYIRLFPISEGLFNRFVAVDLDLPKVELSDPEITYLGILYSKFIEGKDITTSYSLSEIWNDELPKSFRPEQMDSQLVTGGRQITLFGICQIHPELVIFYQFERTLYAIQEILGDGKHHSEVSTFELREKLREFSDEEIVNIFKLLEHFPELYSGIGRAESGELSIRVNDSQVYEAYRQFSGLKSFISNHLKKYPLRSPTIPKQIESIIETPLSAFDLFRTNGRRRSRSDFAPVLGVQTLTENLANMIYHLPPDSQMVGVFGKWGRGKSFLLDELWTYMHEKWKDEFIRIVYHAWKYQETPASWAYLYEQFADTYLGERTLHTFPSYYWKILRLNFRRLGIAPLAIMGLSIIGLFGWVVFSPYILHWKWYYYVGTDILATISVSALFRAFKKELSTKAIEIIRKYSLRHSYKSTLGLQADIQEELITLLKCWIPQRKGSPKKWRPKFILRRETKIKSKKRIFLVVEDMDRCKEDRIIESIDALRVLLEDPEISQRLIIVTAIDERILKNAIRKKYASIMPFEKKGESKESPHTDDFNPQELVSEYIDKLFIAAIKLGELSDDQRVEFLEEVIKTDVTVSPSSPQRKPLSTDGQPKQRDQQAHTGDAGTRVAASSDSTPSSVPTTSESENNSRFTTESATASTNASQTEWKGLNEDEVDLLAQVVRSWPLATPRRINIFYHRYLLCKNTLIGKYLQWDTPNSWQDREGIYTILLLLRYYGGRSTPEAITEEKMRVQTDTSILIDVRNGPSNVKKSKSDYLCLLEILELVIAY